LSAYQRYADQYHLTSGMSPSFYGRDMPFQSFWSTVDQLGWDPFTGGQGQRPYDAGDPRWNQFFTAWNANSNASAANWQPHYSTSGGSGDYDPMSSSPDSFIRGLSEAYGLTPGTPVGANAIGDLSFGLPDDFQLPTVAPGNINSDLLGLYGGLDNRVSSLTGTLNGWDSTIEALANRQRDWWGGLSDTAMGKQIDILSTNLAAATPSLWSGLQRFIDNPGSSIQPGVTSALASYRPGTSFWDNSPLRQINTDIGAIRQGFQEGGDLWGNMPEINWGDSPWNSAIMGMDNRFTQIGNQIGGVTGQAKGLAGLLGNDPGGLGNLIEGLKTGMVGPDGLQSIIASLGTQLGDGPDGIRRALGLVYDKIGGIDPTIDAQLNLVSARLGTAPGGLGADVNALGNRISGINLGPLNSGLSALDQRITGMSSGFDTGMDAFERRINDTNLFPLVSGLSGLGGAIAGLNQDVQNINLGPINSGLWGLNGLIGGLNRDLVGLNDLVGEQDRNLDGLLNGVTGQIGGISRDLGGLSGQTGGLAGLIGGLNGGIDSLNTGMTTGFNDVKRNTFDGLVSMNDLLDRTMTGINSSIEGLGGQFSSGLDGLRNRMTTGFQDVTDDLSGLQLSLDPMALGQAIVNGMLVDPRTAGWGQMEMPDMPALAAELMSGLPSWITSKTDPFGVLENHLLQLMEETPAESEPIDLETWFGDPGAFRDMIDSLNDDLGGNMGDVSPVDTPDSSFTAPSGAGALHDLLAPLFGTPEFTDWTPAIEEKYYQDVVDQMNAANPYDTRRSEAVNGPLAQLDLDYDKAKEAITNRYAARDQLGSPAYRAELRDLEKQHVADRSKINSDWSMKGAQADVELKQSRQDNLAKALLTSNTRTTDQLNRISNYQSKALENFNAFIDSINNAGQLENDNVNALLDYMVRALGGQVNGDANAAINGANNAGAAASGASKANTGLWGSLIGAFTRGLEDKVGDMFDFGG
jgi:hypothetical protein